MDPHLFIWEALIVTNFHWLLYLPMLICFFLNRTQHVLQPTGPRTFSKLLVMGLIPWKMLCTNTWWEPRLSSAAAQTLDRRKGLLTIQKAWWHPGRKLHISSKWYDKGLSMWLTVSHEAGSCYPIWHKTEKTVGSQTWKFREPGVLVIFRSCAKTS